MLPINKYLNMLLANKNANNAKEVYRQTFDQEKIFYDILDGGTPSNIAKKYNTSKQSVTSTFWRTTYRLWYIGGKFSFYEYYNRTCSTNIRVHMPLSDLSEQFLSLREQYEESKNLNIDSKLVQFGIRTEFLKLLADNNIETLRDYIQSKIDIMSINGMGRTTMLRLQECAEQYGC